MHWSLCLQIVGIIFTAFGSILAIASASGIIVQIAEGTNWGSRDVRKKFIILGLCLLGAGAILQILGLLI